MPATIDKITFPGLIGNKKWKEITMNEFVNSLMKSGWRDSQHLYQKLCERGPRLGIHTPNDFARALSKGETVDAGQGDSAHICGSGTWCVIFRGNTFRTFRDAPNRLTNAAKP